VISLSRKSGVSSKQVNRIRELNARGYSANQIQKELRSENIGLRRQIILNYTREFRNRPAQRNVSKYIPKKYRRIYRPIGKVISLNGLVNGEVRRLNVSAYDGRSLHKVIKEKIFNYGDTKKGYSPKNQFLTIDANKLLANPDKYLSKEEWDTRPRINS
jgi:hypothetical protein